eukprot:3331260-Amphidinium_carterae.1
MKFLKEKLVTSASHGQSLSATLFVASAGPSKLGRMRREACKRDAPFPPTRCSGMAGLLWIPQCHFAVQYQK